MVFYTSILFDAPHATKYNAQLGVYSRIRYESVMALKGNLRDFTISQLLNLINIANKSGTLVVDGSGETVSVSFRQGKLAYAQKSQEDNSLAAILYRAKKINSNQLQSIKMRGNQMNDKQLGLMLINANYLTQKEILVCLQTHYINLLSGLFTWNEGNFKFENDMPPPGDKITVHIGLENIIMEGTRRVKEWEHLQDEIPSLEIALKFADRPGTNIKNISLSVDEWRVVKYISPKNTLTQIARAAQLDDMQMRRIAYGLIQAGLVEFVRSQGVTARPTSISMSIPAANKEEQKSLINRLITRIRSL